MKKKIDALFEYRKLPQLLAKGKYSKQSSLYQGLVALQIAIYNLDLYLEANWKIKKTELDKYWKEIFKTLQDLGISKKRGEDYLKHIQRYQKHELQLRRQKLPTEYSLEYYYFYKSCDVKLMRRIIYDYIPVLKQDYSLSDWRIFDLITEIDDDVEDVYEDLDNINGNYFMIMLSEQDKSKVSKLFSNFLDDLGKRTRKKFSSKDKATKEIRNWTLKELKLSKELLKNRITNWDDSKLKKMKLLEFTQNISS